LRKKIKQARLIQLNCYGSELVCGNKRQAALPAENLAQPMVARTALASDDSGGDEFAEFAAPSAATQPVFVAD
jgi:hypothetical protein